jgi:hypothetical protein
MELEDFLAPAITIAILVGLTVLIWWIISKIWPSWKLGSQLITTAGVVVLLLAGIALVSFSTIRSPLPTGSMNPPAAPPPMTESTPPHWENKGSAFATIPDFPWPPPTPSASLVIPNEFIFRNALQHRSRNEHSEDTNTHAELTLYDVGLLLRNALASAGYWENAYFRAPGGFVIVARLERILSDGSPAGGVERFDSSFHPLERFSVAGYLKVLFLAPPGYYRVIAFVVSSVPFAPSKEHVSSEEADIWLASGANDLPSSFKRQIYTREFTCTALIYEFEKRDAGSNPDAKRPGRLSAEVHLAKSGIEAGLAWSP